MPAPDHGDITGLLLAWSIGEQSARDAFIAAVYGELRRLARRHLLAEPPGRTLSTTDLVHEAYLRLIDQHRVQWQNRCHFFAIAAQMMRRILVEHARSRRRAKRGGDAARLPLDEAINLPVERDRGLLVLDDALKALEALDTRKSQVVELRYFGGLSVDETSAILGVSPNTVIRDWNMAKAWLYQEIRGEQKN
jgi:RNA polymerase sigma factor (TIGR02999 family)